MRHTARFAFASYQALPATSLQITLILMTLWLYGCGSGANSTVVKTAPAPESITLSPASSSVRIGGTTMISAIEGGRQLSGGQWSVEGGATQGSVDATGLYTAPSVLPSPNLVTIQYAEETTTVTVKLQLLSCLPSITSTSPESVSQISTPVQVIGSGFVSGSQITVNGVPVPSVYVDPNHLTTVIAMSQPANTTLQLAVLNPNPGAASSAVFNLAANFPITLSASSNAARVGGSVVIRAFQGGLLSSGGQWSVAGGPARGQIDETGLYTAPASVPSVNPVTIQYAQGGAAATASLQILNPLPVVTSTSPNSLSATSTPVSVIGSGFVSGSQIIINSLPISTTYVDASHLSAVVTLGQPSNAGIQLSVANPMPGGSTSAPVTLRASFSITLSPASSAVRVGSSTLISGQEGGLPVSGGQWTVVGGAAQGQIDAKGLYTAPSSVPPSNPVTIQYVQQGGALGTAAIQVLGPVPVVVSTNPTSISRSSTPLTIVGSGFVAGSQVVINQVAVPTIYVDQNHLTAIVTVSDPTTTAIQLSVTNPDPGTATSGPISIETHLPLTLQVTNTAVRVGTSTTVSAFTSGQPATKGQWSVIGGAGQGFIDASGIYTAPVTLPGVNPVTVQYTEGGTTAAVQIQVLNPAPVIVSVNPAALSQMISQITISGKGFIFGSQVMVNGAPVATTYVDSTHLGASITLPKPENTTLQITVSNPDPGAVSSLPVNIGTAFPTLSVAPATLTPGQISLNVSGSSFTQTSVVLINGKAFSTTYNSATSLTAQGYLPPWTNGPVDLAVSDSSSGQTVAELSVPLVPVQVPYDTAARFATQAAFGPNPAVIAHIQQTGLQGFIAEQLQAPGVAYPLTGPAPRSRFLQAAIQGYSPLRLRVAWGLRSYLDVPNEGSYAQVSEWEVKLETAATGNYRDLMTVLASDPTIGRSLNLVGNVAPSDPTLHPNQNFAREFMQLFTIGTVLLNDDGTQQLDSNGQTIPTYDQDTIINLSRVFTGWENAIPVNPQTTFEGVDFSQNLVPVESEHDTRAKLLFGTYTLPAGHTTTQDRDRALDIIFAHPNLPPFVSRILIQKLVKGSPSPEYVHRIANVFKDDGTGTRGNLAAVVTAILLDPEARSGDTVASADDGFVQDPLMAEIFAMSALQDSGSDDQFSYWPQYIGENFWVPPSVFSFYSPSYLIPGTSINSPEYSLLNNATIIHRSQLLWGIVSGQQAGLNLNSNSWLYQNFHDVPSIVDALNHLLYHGQMPDEEKAAILAYCAQLDPSDVQTQLYSAVFLALNSDSYTVAH